MRFRPLDGFIEITVIGLAVIVNLTGFFAGAGLGAGTGAGAGAGAGTGAGAGSSRHHP